MPDLWPEDFGSSAEKPPVAILREQGEHLGRRTKGMVDGVVQTTRDGEQFVHHFVLRAPLLDNYTYVLLTIRHPLDFYPLNLTAHVMNSQFTNLRDEGSFVQRLTEVLNSDQTKSVIKSLKSQSEEAGTGTAS